jgi:hypothetical protein
MAEGRSWFMGGMLLSCSYSLLQTDVFKTVVLAVIGTLTSYLFGKLLALAAKWLRKKKE